MARKPDELLQEAVDIFKARREVYGDNYMKHGYVMTAFFPDSIPIVNSAKDHSRFGLLTQIISKLTRYCENFSKGGHDDSLADLSVYAAILRSLDQEINADDIPF